MLPCLAELQVRNLALIEQATLRLSDGLNVITGETGAGKTMLAKALDLLLGAKTPKGVVRPGADHAYIEGVFALPDGWQPQADDGELAELVGDGGEVILARRIAASGRSRCLINGQTVSVDTLRALAGQLVTFYGQHEQRRLMLDHAQTDLLDRSGDGRGAKLRMRFAELRGQALGAQRRLDQLQRAQATSQRELELARFELAELDELAPLPEEETSLLGELTRLESADAGRHGCQTAGQALNGDEEHAAGAISLVTAAAAALDGLDVPAASDLAARLESARLELSDIADELERLGDGWESDPVRAQQVQTRLEAFHRLERKHHCDFAGLLDVRSRLQATVAGADDRPAMIAQAQAEAQQALAATMEAASVLSAWRAKQAPRLARAVSGVLGELAMEAAEFAVRLLPADGDGLAGLTDTGGERVVFTLKANPGLPEEELAQVASGGEASRLMLALISQVDSSDGGLLVLDEPDAGLGGQTAHGVAQRLKALAGQQQVLVISHLPQIAARADRHLRLYKQVDAAVTVTRIEALDSDELILDELCRLAGHQPTDPAARQAAQTLRA